MGSYTAENLSGRGTEMEALSAGVEYTFVLKRPVNYLSGSGYVTVETIPNTNGNYGGKDTNALGIYNLETGVEGPDGLVTSSYVSSVIVHPTSNYTSSYSFTPTADLLISSSMLRATGGIYIDINAVATGYVFPNRAALKIGVDLWESDRAQALATYGEINTWLVYLVTEMYGLFRNMTTFNSDISNWDVSNVTNMIGMFYKSQFNGDISKWDVSNVIDCRSFRTNTSWTLPIPNFTNCNPNLIFEEEELGGY